MKKLDVHLTLKPKIAFKVGSLAEDKGHLYFEYDSVRWTPLSRQLFQS